MVIAAVGPEPPPSGRELLAAELRRLRELSGWSGRRLAERIGISQSKVSRIESGSAIPSLPEVKRWGKALEVSVETQERLVSLAEAAFTEVHPYRAALQRRGHLQDYVHEGEQRADWVRTFQSEVVPGLLQIPDYTRSVLALGETEYSPEDLAAAIGGRLHRQLDLYDPTRRFDFLITESALRWRPGSVDLQVAQLDRLSNVATLENVSVGLVPLDRQATAQLSHSFVLRDHRDEEQEDSVVVELVHGLVTLVGAANREPYEARWAKLAGMALHGDEARDFLAESIAHLRRSRA
ncbi:helix-turn-helix domain-containing protein [Saccharothrix australiensis]|uniref:Helix-turn-helix protein n=1 Tax=Saccharothrix australiensis TaxID=2072 RepID=A0A495W0N5_9PSEU|nr:helix-turn-helix transcriptional regulator [Saccharothrix australiensis]RKT54255.1 helix-turn-helix protein [Saccharothrix australiensis]